MTLRSIMRNLCSTGLASMHVWAAQDAERMAGVLEDAGYSCAAEAGDADVIIYNTCSIRDKAEQKVYSALGKQACAWHSKTQANDLWAALPSLAALCVHIHIQATKVAHANNIKIHLMAHNTTPAAACGQGLAADFIETLMLKLCHRNNQASTLFCKLVH